MRALVAQPLQEPFGIGLRRLGEELERHHLREPAAPSISQRYTRPQPPSPRTLEDAVATTLQWNPETEESVSEGTLESPGVVRAGWNGAGSSPDLGYQNVTNA
jgi:hypothetical protein